MIDPYCFTKVSKVKYIINLKPDFLHMNLPARLINRISLSYTYIMIVKVPGHCLLFIFRDFLR